MLKTRVMPTLLYKDVGLVKGVGFDSWRRVGWLMQAIKVYNMREVDELVFLDISATRENREPDYTLVDEFADECFMPLTVGGGVRTVEHVRRLLSVGADKVAINTAAMETPQLIQEVAQEFGSQCVVVSMDVKKNAGGSYEVFTHSGTRATGRDPVSFSKQAEALGCGEILLTSIERDGSFKGYDLELTRMVTNAVTIPIIASGGAGSYDDMVKAIALGGASAVAAASIFHFTQMTPLEAKQAMKTAGIPVRL
jgi:cyclase